MFCDITLGMMLTAHSIAGMPCSNFQVAEAAPRMQLASLEQPTTMPRAPAPVIAAPRPTASVSIEDDGGKRVTLVIVTKARTIKTEVARKYGHQFKGFITWLAGTGYPIEDVGCYSFRYIDPRYTGGQRTLSEHAKAKACDINQCDRNKVGVCGGPKGRLVKAIPFPANTNAMAHKFGLMPGAEWRNTPDTGHFQVETTIAEKHWPVVLASGHNTGASQ